MSRQKWNKKLNYMYPLLATKLKSPVHIPQLVFFALLSCTLWASPKVLHRDPSQYRTPINPTCRPRISQLLSAHWLTASAE